MSKFIKGFLLVAEVEPFLRWLTETGKASWTYGKGVWQCAQVHTKNAEGLCAWQPIIRDKHNIISISDEVKLLVQEWKQAAGVVYTDTRMLDWLIESQATVSANHKGNKTKYILFWPAEAQDPVGEANEYQSEWYDSPREAIMAQMRAEGQ